MILRQPTRRSPEVNTPGRSCNRDLYLLGLTQLGLRVTSLQRHSRFALICFDILYLFVHLIASYFFSGKILDEQVRLFRQPPVEADRDEEECGAFLEPALFPQQIAMQSAGLF